MTRAWLLLATAGCLTAQVTFERIVNAGKEPQNWLIHSGTYDGNRYTTLNQITPDNVKNLGVQWVFQSRMAEKFEVTPLVVDGVMYITEATNNVYALDAATGRAFWEFRYSPAHGPRVCCGLLNRGVAILGDTLFIGTLDGYLLAIDARNGKLVWKTQVVDYTKGYSLVHAPLVVKDKVIVGPAGGEFGIRGFLAAYRCQDRKGSLALQHGSRTRRTRQRDLGRRLVEDRRRSYLAYRHL